MTVTFVMNIVVRSVLFGILAVLLHNLFTIVLLQQWCVQKLCDLIQTFLSEQLCWMIIISYE